jgi:hypothetical protein
VTALAGLLFGWVPNGVTVSAQNGKDKKGRVEQSKPVQTEGVLPESWNPEKERAAKFAGGEDISAVPVYDKKAEAEKYVSLKLKNGQGTLTAESPAISEGAEMNRRERQKEGKKNRKTSPKAKSAVSAQPVTQPAAVAAKPAAAPKMEVDFGVAQDPQPQAPVLTTSFDAADFATNAATNAGGLFIPPDCDGAAGPGHVVNVINCTIEWYTKAGVRQNQQSLRAFFTPATLPPGYVAPADATFDPKVLYDTQANRFVVITISGAASAASRVYLAVSQTSDPNDGWFYYQFASNVTIAGNNTWFDFPGFAVDSQAIYITGNMFRVTGGAFGGVRLWIIPKTPFYTGGTPTNAIYDPITTAGGDGAVATTAQPAIIYGSTPGTVGTYLMQYSGLSDGTNEFLGAIQIENPLTTPVFTGRFVALGDIEATNVALPTTFQRSNGVRVATNDRRVSNHPIFRNNVISLAAPFLPTTGPDAGQVTVRWWQVNVSDFAAPTLVDTGIIGGEEIAPGAFTYFPSVSVNSVGSLAIGFSISAPSIFPSSAYTSRRATDPAGTTQAPSILRSGTDYYFRQFGATNNRWGDYSGIAVDPTDDSFWVYNQHSISRGTVTATFQDGRYGTAWGRFSAEANAPVLYLGTVTSAESNTNVSNNNGAVEAGEVAALTVPLRNLGTADASGITATLTTSTPGVTILSGANKAYPGISVGGSATPAVPFGFQLAPGFPCGGLIDFTLNVTSNGGSQTLTFQTGVGPTTTANASTLIINETLDGTAPAANALYTATTGVTSATGFRLNRDGVASTCANQKTSLGHAGAAGARRYDAYTFQNPGSTPICVSINHATTCTAAGQDQFSAVYYPTFNPANILDNWRADRGVAANSVAGTTFSVTIPARQSFTLVVSEVNPAGSAACGTYTLTVTGLVTGSCAGGAPFTQAVVNSNVSLAVTGQSVNAPTCGAQGYSNDLVLNATLTNTGTTTLQNPAFQVTELREANGTAPAVPFRLISADGATCTSGGLVGAIQTVSTPVSLLPGQSVNVTFTIAIPSVRRLRFLFNVLGVNTGVGQRQSVEKSAAAPLGFDVAPNAFDNSLAVTKVAPSGNASEAVNASDRAAKKR